MLHSLNKIIIGALIGWIFLILPTTLWSQTFPNQRISISERILNPFKGDLPELRKRRLIRVLVSYTRTNFFLTPKGFRGLEYDLLMAYEAYLNRGPRKQRYETHLTFIPMPFSDILPKLQAGYGDIAASGFTITPEREAMVDFTSPYINNVKEILVSSKDAEPIEKLADFSGKQIIVVSNSSYIIHLEAINQTLGRLGLPTMEIVKADPLIESEDILELINEGIYQYTVVDNHIAYIWQRVLDNIQLHEDMIVHHDSNIGWAIQKNNPRLKASLNDFIQAYAQPGRFLGNAIFQKYFKNTYWIEKPLTHDLLKRVHCLKYYFQLYAEFYGFDWKLIAALAYQESRFDPNKRSHAGAIGIMQVRPSTARDRNVNLPDIKKLETNIHAGVKYLAFLRDRYFSSNDYTPEEKDNFTLAAYNAGPRKVLQLQQKTKQLGLNPYKWFYNVETTARQVIGHETVNYVTSIQKMRIFLDASKRLDQNKRLYLEKTVSENEFFKEDDRP
uniref:Solute-binding protein family 3/N-terminal domain-containing protein n=1 Tax=Hydrogenovibrio crunogenus (strain DSM 25203 / XCL-2) TaxID=317025 RepID=Q31FI9_HYDCU